MALDKKRKRERRVETAAKPENKNAQKHTSGAPSSTGGSRQGNAGHEGSGPDDNTHR